MLSVLPCAARAITSSLCQALELHLRTVSERDSLNPAHGWGNPPSRTSDLWPLSQPGPGLHSAQKTPARLQMFHVVVQSDVYSGLSNQT